MSILRRTTPALVLFAGSGSHTWNQTVMSVAISQETPIKSAILAEKQGRFRTSRYGFLWDNCGG
jgi:hypothetical protein